MKNIKILIPAFGICSLLTGYSAIVYGDLYTDGSGNFGAGTSWSGDGAVQANAGALNYPVASGPYDDEFLIDGLSSGTLQLGEVSATGSPAGGGLASGITGSLSVSISGSGPDPATGDLYFDAYNVLGPVNFSITNLQNANSVTLTYAFSEGIAAWVPGTNLTTGTQGQPFIAALGALGDNLGTYDISASYQGLTYTTDNITYVAGLPVGTTGTDMVFDGLTWDGVNGTGSGTNITLGIHAPNGRTRFQGLNGFDTSSGDNFTTNNSNTTTVAEDEERVYATGVSFTITPNGGGNFASDTQIITSTNGTQWDPIPEPSAGLLGLLAGLSFLARRRR